MSIDDFERCSTVLHGLTADFVRAVPDDRWNLPPDRSRAVDSRRLSSFDVY